MDPDLAGQNDTSYQGEPTGLLHADKLHLHFRLFAWRLANPAIQTFSTTMSATRDHPGPRNGRAPLFPRLIDISDDSEPARLHYIFYQPRVGRDAFQ